MQAPPSPRAPRTGAGVLTVSGPNPGTGLGHRESAGQGHRGVGGGRGWTRGTPPVQEPDGGDHTSGGSGRRQGL